MGTQRSGNDRRWAATSDQDDRATTAAIFDPLHKRFEFTIDVAAAAHNAKLPRFYDREQDGLTQSWAGESVYCNPPYSSIEPWVAKAWREYADTLGIAMLLPANRTEQGWWQTYVEPFRDRAGSPLTVEFMAGRVRFLRPGRDRIGPGERPPFGVCLLVWNRPVAATLTLPMTLGEAI